MKSFWPCLCLLVLPQWAWPHVQPPRSADDVAAQRQQISESMQQQNARLDEEARACSQKFAVTACVNAVESRRRAAIAELRRQEAVLNTAERRQRGQEQIERLDEKARERARQESELAPPGGRESDRKKEELAEKQRQHAAQPDGRGSVDKGVKRATIIDAQQAEKNRTEANRKLEEARKRRLERDKRVKEKSGAANGIPVPP